MTWTIDEAKRRLNEVIDAANFEPQIICNQEEPVAVIIEAKLLEEFLMWKKEHSKPSLSEAFSELRQLCEQENYILEIPERHNRSNPFL